MKKILIFGANGKVGRILTQKLKESSGFVPKAALRKEDQVAFFRDKGIDCEVVSLEDSVQRLSEVIEGMDAIVFTAGSGGKTGDDMTLAIDLDGAVKTMEAAEELGVKRFVMVSAINADNRSKWKASGINGYYIAKHYADRALKESGLDYTILRPGLLLDEPGRGQLNVSDPESTASVAREDVASLILEILDKNNTIGKTITFNQGDTPIEEVVKNI